MPKYEKILVIRWMAFLLCLCIGVTVMGDPLWVSGSDWTAVTIYPALKEYGEAGSPCSLLEGVRTDPEFVNGKKVLVRVAEIRANGDDNFHWDGSVVINRSVSTDVSYTVVYQAYHEGESSSLAELEFTLRSRGEKGERLDGDYAYISEAWLTPDDSTESGRSIATGRAPWNLESDKGKAGADTTEKDNLVRTFDSIDYTVSFMSKVREDSPFKVYKEGYLYFEFIVPGESGEVEFNTEAMPWLKKEGTDYTARSVAHDGKTYQVLRGKYLLNSATLPQNIGEVEQTLTISLFILGMKNGATVQPYFTFWLEGNEVPASGLVTGSGFTCGQEGHGVEYKTVETPPVMVTAEPRYNIQVRSASCPLVGDFDFGTGNNEAPNKKTGLVLHGQMDVYGVTLQILGKKVEIVDESGRKKEVSLGLRGCELPDGNPITFDLLLESKYTVLLTNREYRVTAVDEDFSGEKLEGYQPLLWSLEGNRKSTGGSTTQLDGRVVSATHYALSQAPFNRLSENDGNKAASCQDGGSWSAVQDGNIISVTVSGYTINPKQLPSENAGGSSGTYYTPGKNFWEVDKACFSAGEIWIVQPDTSAAKKKITDEVGNGAFEMSLMDGNLRVTSKSGVTIGIDAAGRKPEEVAADTSNQGNQSDDIGQKDYILSGSGTLNQLIAYMKPSDNITSGLGNAGNALTEGSYRNGKDWIFAGAGLRIYDLLIHSNLTSAGLNKGVAYDVLIKFDDAFFEPDGNAGFLYKNESGKNNSGFVKNKIPQLTYLFGARLEKSGWSHKGEDGTPLQPGDPEYDRQMTDATADDLIFFSSYEELVKAGYTCVALLVEARGVSEDDEARISGVISGYAKKDCPPGCVYMTTHCAKVWSEADVRDAAAAYCGKAPENLTDADYRTYVWSGQFPTRSEDQMRLKAGKRLPQYQNVEDYPKSFYTNDASTNESLRNYVKTTYNDKGGTVRETVGINFGDSCLVTSYRTDIEKDTAQKTSGGEAKTDYFIDSNETVVDYVLRPRVFCSSAYAGSQTDSGGKLSVDLQITDTLPAGLTYRLGSARRGGNYLQIGEGRQGTVEGGTAFEPDQIRKNTDGSTTLVWTLKAQVAGSVDGVALDPIYYTCDIATNVGNGTTLANTAKIAGENEQWTPGGIVGGADVCNIRCSRLSSESVLKTVEKPIVDVDEAMNFLLETVNGSTEGSMKLLAIDSLPYKNDGVSSFQGICRVTGITVKSRDILGGENGVKFYYTVDENARGKRSSDYKDVDLSTDSAWIPIAVDSQTGEAALPEAFEPTAIAAVGELPAQKALSVRITLALPGSRNGDYVANHFSNGLLESTAWCYIVSRTVKGSVWLDANVNGLREAAEGGLDGVGVSLLQLKEGGDPMNPEDYTTVLGSTTTGDGGKYRFSGLPAGTCAIRFSGNLLGYKSSPRNQGNDEQVDSDAIPVYGEDGNLQSAWIFPIDLPATDRIYTKEYVSGYNDLGLYHSIDFCFTKVKAEATSEGLAGAKFQLFYLVCRDASHNHDGLLDPSIPPECMRPVGEVMSDAKGRVSFTGLFPGKYRLVETKAPKGRLLPTGQWQVTVDEDRSIHIEALGDMLPPAFAEGKDGELLLPNMRPRDIPSSGAVGTGLFSVAGALLMAAGVLAGAKAVRKRRKRE